MYFCDVFLFCLNRFKQVKEKYSTEIQQKLQKVKMKSVEM